MGGFPLYPILEFFEEHNSWDAYHLIGAHCHPFFVVWRSEYHKLYIYIGFPGIYNSRCIVLLSTTGGNLAIVSGFVAGWGRFVMEKLN